MLEGDQKHEALERKLFEDFNDAFHHLDQMYVWKDFSCAFTTIFNWHCL